MARFIDAVRFWAETTGNKYKIPRKGTAEYTEVMGFLEELNKIEARDAKPKKASKMSAPMGGAGASYPAPAPAPAPKMSKAERALERAEAKFQAGRLRAIAKDKAEAMAPAPVMKKKRKIRIVEEPVEAKPMRFPKARRAVARAVPNPAAKEMKTIEQSAIVSSGRSRAEAEVKPEKYPVARSYKQALKKFNKREGLTGRDAFTTADFASEMPQKSVAKMIPPKNVSDYLDLEVASYLVEKGEPLSNVMKAYREEDEDDEDFESWFDIKVRQLDYALRKTPLAFRTYLYLTRNEGLSEDEVLKQMEAMADEGYDVYDEFISLMTGKPQRRGF